MSRGNKKGSKLSPEVLAKVRAERARRKALGSNTWRQGEKVEHSEEYDPGNYTNPGRCWKRARIPMDGWENG